MEGEYSNKYMRERVKHCLNCYMTENTGTKAPSFTVASKTLRKFWKNIYEQKRPLKAEQLCSFNVTFYMWYCIDHKCMLTWAHLYVLRLPACNNYCQLYKFEVEVIIYIIMHIYTFEIKIVPYAWSWAIYLSDKF